MVISFFRQMEKNSFTMTTSFIAQQLKQVFEIIMDYYKMLDPCNKDNTNN